MATELTFAIIKPKAVLDKHVGHIISAIEETGFKIKAIKKLQFTIELAQKFYAVHADKPFFEGLTANISSNPVIALILEKENAIQAWRDLMGATRPDEAGEGTIRKRFGTNIDFNAVHGSDAADTAKIESGLIFSELKD